VIDFHRIIDRRVKRRFLSTYLDPKSVEDRITPSHRPSSCLVLSTREDKSLSEKPNIRPHCENLMFDS
jgi:hypothetical protein